MIAIAWGAFLHYFRSMKRIFLLLGLTCLMPLPALADMTATLQQWQRLRDVDAPAPSFSEATGFLADHPGWPDEKTIRIRAEMAAYAEHPDPSILGPYCTSTPPITGRGMFACLRTKVGDPATRRDWLHKGWIQGDFAESEERSILGEYREELRVADHTARLERLLYEEKATAAKRMVELVPLVRRPIYNARIALLQKDKKSKKLVNALSAAQKLDIGLRFTRAQIALEQKELATLVTLIRDIPAAAPHADLWWPLRNVAIREAIEKKQYPLALAMTKSHGDISGEAQAEALWLKGWITLEFMKDAKTAYPIFRELYTEVGTPVSRARAAYWAGRAANLNGNPDIARDWWNKAANYPTVFYGQLAHLALHPDAPLNLPIQPEASETQRDSFEKDELVQAVRLLHANGDDKLAERFLAQLTSNATSPARFAMVASLAREVGGVSGEVKIAKLALRRQTILIESGWPRIGLPQTLGVEPALALAISRQESEFDPLARSAANARGMMQLLPATARQIAKRNDWSYSDDALDNPGDNIMLGTSYLGQIINGFNGSYVLGIASYNAGPGSVRRWINDMGTPPKNLGATLNWIESIPFGETRNYVMRVMENIQIYRALESPQKPLTLDEDLTR